MSIFVFSALSSLVVFLHKTNSQEGKSIDADAAGNIYILQNSACCIDARDNTTINREPVGPYDTPSGKGDIALLILNKNFGLIRHNVFKSRINTAGCHSVDMVVRGSYVAFVGISTGNMITANPLPGTAMGKDLLPTGYLVVLPTFTDIN